MYLNRSTLDYSFWYSFLRLISRNLKIVSSSLTWSSYFAYLFLDLYTVHVLIGSARDKPTWSRCVGDPFQRADLAELECGFHLVATVCTSTWGSQEDNCHPNQPKVNALEYSAEHFTISIRYSVVGDILLNIYRLIRDLEIETLNKSTSPINFICVNLEFFQRAKRTPLNPCSSL